MGKICESLFRNLRQLDNAGYQAIQHAGKRIWWIVAEKHSNSQILLFDYDPTAGKSEFPNVLDLLY